MTILKTWSISGVQRCHFPYVKKRRERREKQLSQSQDYSHCHAWYSYRTFPHPEHGLSPIWRRVNSRHCKLWFPPLRHVSYSSPRRRVAVSVFRLSLLIFLLLRSFLHCHSIPFSSPSLVQFAPCPLRHSSKRPFSLIALLNSPLSAGHAIRIVSSPNGQVYVDVSPRFPRDRNH